ncbi:MAG: murein biosynthesis integral membrane protein MurJ [Helicobacteraceae bacterium]|nr:murein biosynthesis integral membrane protein MurJ [Helicobacteraceae bacterium]
MFRSIFTNSFGILFSRILGLWRDLLTASVLGANIYSDIFFVAFKLPNLFRRIFAEGAFSQTFIPSFSLTKHKAVFSVHILLIFLFSISLLTLVVNLFPQVATEAIAYGFSDENIRIAAPYVAINFFYLPLIFAVTFLSALLQYKHHFATTAFSTGLLNISLIVALLLSQDLAEPQIVTYLSYGVVIGGALQLIVHLIAIYKLNLLPLLVGGFKYLRVKSRIIKKDTTKFTKQFLPAMWGNSALQISSFIDTILASFLLSGAISYLYYANRIFQLPLALFAIATSIALFPKVARHINNNREEEASNMMAKAFWFLTFLLGFSTIGGIVLSEEIISLLFERGAFSAKDTLSSSTVLKMYLIGLLPFGLSKLFLLWIYAHHEQMKAAKIASIALGFNVILSLSLISPLGTAGLALASSLSGFITFSLTLKAFGYDKFKAIIRSKNTIYLLLSFVVFTYLLIYLKGFIHVYF